MIEKIQKKLYDIKNAPTWGGRTVTAEEYVRDVTYLLDLVHKSEGMAQEINLLTKENRELLARFR